MFPKTHIIINFFISLPLLFIINPVFVLIFFLSSFLIDVDHYLYYIFKKKSFSLKKAYNWFVIGGIKLRKLSKQERKKHNLGIMIFHGIEQIIILTLISAIFLPLFYIALGFFIHLIEDLIEDIPLGITKRKVSLIYSIYYYNKLNKTSNKK